MDISDEQIRIGNTFKFKTTTLQEGINHPTAIYIFALTQSKSKTRRGIPKKKAKKKNQYHRNDSGVSIFDFVLIFTCPHSCCVGFISNRMTSDHSRNKAGKAERNIGRYKEITCQCVYAQASFKIVFATSIFCCGLFFLVCFCPSVWTELPFQQVRGES